MALKNSQYNAIMRKYEQVRLKNHDLQNARYEEVYKGICEEAYPRSNIQE